MQYRAWGGLKHANYGDGPQINVTYNARLLPTRYEMSNVFLSQLVNGGYFTVGTENDYFADGRLRYARDLQDGNFDRAFAYDHAGRLKEAYSGREARGLSPNNPADSPYRQTFSYNVWNNMSRTGRHWTAPVSDTPTYTNNRRSDWSYDASGNVTARDFGQRTHAYDAAGQQRNFYEEGLDLYPQGHYVWHQYTINQTYDAAGAVGKRIETRHSEDENGVLEDYIETSYQLRSTVLGGALIADIDQWGNRGIGHVYAGGELLADYQYLAPYTITTIQHRNATTGQWVKNAVRAELDPLGAEVGYFNPYTYGLSYADMIGTDDLYYIRGNAMDIRGGCALDGMPISCSELADRMERGIVDQEYSYPEFAQGQPRLNSSTERASTTPGVIWHTQRVPIVSLGIGLYITSVPVLAGGPVRSTNNNEGYYLDWRDDVFRLTESEVNTLEDNLTKVLGDADCGTFINTVLAKLPDDVWMTTKYNTSLGAAFDRIKNGGGFWTGDTMSKEALARTDPNALTMTFDSQRVRPLIQGQPWHQLGATLILVHELTHVFTNSPNAGAYGHLQMAQAASAAAISLGFDVKQALGLDFPTAARYGTGDAYDVALSYYYDKTVKYACRKVKL